MFDLVLSYFSPTYVQEPKYPDYIFVKDYRQYDNKGQLMMSHQGTPTKADHPNYYILDANMTNVYSQDYFRWNSEMTAEEAQEQGEQVLDQIGYAKGRMQINKDREAYK